jgi:hypothetical protein
MKAGTRDRLHRVRNAARRLCDGIEKLRRDDVVAVPVGGRIALGAAQRVAGLVSRRLTDVLDVAAGGEVQEVTQYRVQAVLDRGSEADAATHDACRAADGKIVSYAEPHGKGCRCVFVPVRVYAHTEVR